MREAGLKTVSRGHNSLCIFLHEGVVVPTPDLLEGSWEDLWWSWRSTIPSVAVGPSGLLS